MSTEETTVGAGWVLAGIGAVISTLLTGVITLFRMRETETTKSIAKLEQSLEEINSKADKCEEDRQKLFTSCEVMKFKIDVLEQRISQIDVQGTKFSHKLTNDKPA